MITTAGRYATALHEARRGRASRPRRRRRSPAASATAVVCGPIETTGMPSVERRERARGRGRGEHDEVALRRLRGPQLDRAVERDEVGAELVDEQPPGALGGGEEDAARRRAGARRAAPPASRPPGRGRRRAHARRAPRPSPGRSRRAAPARPRSRRASSRAPFAARDDHPVVAGDVDRRRPSGSISISGQRTTSWPSARSRSRAARLPLGPGDDHRTPRRPFSHDRRGPPGSRGTQPTTHAIIEASARCET